MKYTLNHSNEQDIAELKKRLKERNLSGNFCLVPFTTLNLQPDGSVSVCRHKGSDYTVGNIHEKTLKEIWNGKKLQDWRQEFLSGKIETCRWEIENLSCQHCSFGHSLWDKVDLQTNPENILRLGANFNGECNLQCRMCYIWTQESGYYDKNNYWPLLEKNLFPFLEIIELYSGEPFIQKDTFRLSRVMKKINPSCRWSVTTNGQFDYSYEIESFLINTNLEHLIFSLDSMDPKQYAMIRKGGDLNKILKNIEKIQQFYEAHPQIKKPHLIINFLLMKDNIKEIPFLTTWSKERGLELSIGVLQRPASFSLLELPIDEKMDALTFLYKCSKNGIALSQRLFKSLLFSLPIQHRKVFLLKNYPHD